MSLDFQDLLARTHPNGYISVDEMNSLLDDMIANTTPAERAAFIDKYLPVPAPRLLFRPLHRAKAILRNFFSWFCRNVNKCSVRYVE